MKVQRIYKTIYTLCLVSLSTLTLSVSDPAFAKSREGLPGRRIGGGTRGDCLANAKRLTALVPKSNLGLTKDAYPTLFFYLPQTSAPSTIEFVLRDDRDREAYRSVFLTTGKTGIIQLRLPENASLPPLTVGKNYRWYFSMICDSANRAKDISVEGWIQRVEVNPVLAQKLSRATPIERASLYASSGLWNDALVTLATLQQTQPKDASITAAWSQLLRSVELDTISQEPLISVSVLQPTQASPSIAAPKQ